MVKVKRSSVKSSKTPQTMEELLAVTSYTLKGVKKGDVVEGKSRASRDVR